MVTKIHNVAYLNQLLFACEKYLQDSQEPSDLNLENLSQLTGLFLINREIKSLQIKVGLSIHGHIHKDKIIAKKI